jgi:hypothetical protein
MERHLQNRKPSRPRFKAQTCALIGAPVAKPSSVQNSAHAAMLDRLADAELQHGHHLAAERLAWRAAALRGAA